MVASSYPKFPGDVTAPFIESIAHAVAARGHAVDVLVPHHPDLRRPRRRARARDLVPRTLPARNGAGGDTPRAWKRTCASAAASTSWPRWWRSRCAAPWAPCCGSRRYDVAHAHWVVPNAAMITDIVAAHRVPFVVSAHGSDIFLAERSALVGAFARATLERAACVTACSDDLRVRAVALGAAAVADAHGALRRRCRRLRFRGGRRDARGARCAAGRDPGAGAGTPRGEEGLRPAGGGGGRPSRRARGHRGRGRSPREPRATASRRRARRCGWSDRWIGRRSRGRWRRRTWWPFRPSSIARETWTACRTRCWRRWPRGGRWWPRGWRGSRTSSPTARTACSSRPETGRAAARRSRGWPRTARCARGWGRPPATPRVRRHGWDTAARRFEECYAEAAALDAR